MNWVIEDSEQEDELDSVLRPTEPQAHTTSAISDFTPYDILVPASNQTSPISKFTAENASTDSIIVPSTSVAVPVKPKRPKPRPAYKGSAAQTSSGVHDGTVASAVATAINQTSPRVEDDYPFAEPTFSLDIAERTRAHKRNPTGTSSIEKERARSSSSFRTSGSIVEGSSKGIIIAISSDAEEAEPGQPKRAGKPRERKKSRQQSTAHDPDISHRSEATTRPLSNSPSSRIPTTRGPSPLFDRQQRNPESTPPSSPFQPRKAKRRVLIDDDDFVDANVDAGNEKSSSSILSKMDGEPSTKKQKRSKGARKGKTTNVIDGDAASRTKTSVTSIDKRRTKAKDKAPDQEFKSKEFIEESDDDDLLLVPKSSKSATRSTLSDPGNADISVRSSINASVKPSVSPMTNTAQASAHILPSPSVSIRPSVVISVLPSVDISAPPLSPIVPASSPLKKTKPGKLRNKRAVVADSNSDGATKETNAVSGGGDMDHARNTAAVRVSDGASVEHVKGEKKVRKRKKTVDEFAPVDDVGKSNSPPVFDDARSTEEDSILIGKAGSNKKKNRKKQGTVVSSDEEEPECASFKGNSNGMELDQMGTKQSRGEEDKENEGMSPKPGPEKAPAPANLKSQVTTPHMPSRRDSMSALIRRVSSKVQSPLATPSSNYSPSPLAKSSRRTLSRIAPLHPNRRTPPPAPPRPPAPKKSKKMLDLEEKWEMELADTVEGWSCMGDDERAALRRAKRDAELGYED